MENNGADNTAPLGPRPSRVREPVSLSRSRARLLQALTELGRPTALTELTGITGLHENTLRGHLHDLAEAGLVTRRPAEPDGRGRPAWLWSAVQTRISSEYAGLAGALATTLARTSTDPAADSVATGVEWGRSLVRTVRDRDGGAESSPTGDDRTPRERRLDVVELMETLGFAPESGPSVERVRLTRCPLLEVAKEHPEVVCNVHAGLVRGALAESGDETIDVRLEAFAEPGACLLHLREVGP